MIIMTGRTPPHRLASLFGQHNDRSRATNGRCSLATTTYSVRLLPCPSIHTLSHQEHRPEHVIHVVYAAFGRLVHPHPRCPGALRLNVDVLVFGAVPPGRIRTSEKVLNSARLAHGWDAAASDLSDKICAISPPLTLSSASPARSLASLPPSTDHTFVLALIHDARSSRAAFPRALVSRTNL